MTFNPNDYLTELRGKKYLETKFRVMWFKDEHPNGSIRTEVVSLEPIIMKATIANGQGEVLSTGHGTASTAGSNAVWKGREFEKAETAAVGRALAHAGFGTQFVEDDDSEIVDSPVQRGKKQPPAQKQQQTENGNTQAPPTDMFGGLPEEDKPDIETNVVSATIIEKIKGKGVQKHIKCQTEAGMNVVAWTRSTFTDKGYNEAEQWTVVNQQYTPVLPIPVTLRYSSADKLYTLHDVKPAAMEEAMTDGPKVSNGKKPIGNRIGA